jgi:hypothetical protein
VVDVIAILVGATASPNCNALLRNIRRQRIASGVRQALIGAG